MSKPEQPSFAIKPTAKKLSQVAPSPSESVSDETRVLSSVPVESQIGNQSRNRRKSESMQFIDEATTGVINPAELYTLNAFKRRLGLADAALRSARRKGLRVTYVHKHGFVLGRDWIEYVLNSKSSRPPAADIQ